MLENKKGRSLSETVHNYVSHETINEQNYLGVICKAVRVAYLNVPAKYISGKYGKKPYVIYNFERGRSQSQKTFKMYLGMLEKDDQLELGLIAGVYKAGFKL